MIVPGVGDSLRDGDLAALGALVDRSMAMAEHALRDRDLETLGARVDRSMAMAERGLKNQVPETSFLARAARERGAVAASAFGAGFGGAVWAMVRTTDADAFVAAWRAAYADAFPRRAARAHWLVTRPGGPARAEKV